MGVMGRGVPFFISRKLKTGTRGLKESSKELIDDLSAIKNGKMPLNKKQQPHSHPENNSEDPLQPVNQ
jgi:hypothetical protein